MTDSELVWQPRLWPAARPAKEEQIADFEASIGYKLPGAYRDCVAKYQGMSPDKAVFDFLERGHDQTTAMGLLFHFVGPEEEDSRSSFSVIENFRRLSPYLPPNYIAISEDPGGNPIALRFDAGKENAEVVYVDLEADRLESAVSFVASDFPSFLAILRGDGRR